MRQVESKLHVTDAAGAYLAQKLDELDTGDALRFVFGLRGMESQPSTVLPGDTVYEFQGKTVLVLDPTVSNMLADKTLDIEHTQNGPVLRLS